MANLYEINERFSKAIALFEGDEFDEQTVTDTLEAIEGEFQEKGKNIAAFIGNMKAEEAAIAEAIKNMTHRKKVLANKAASMKAYLLENMQAAGINKIECAYFVISIKKNPPAMIIENDDDVPEKYVSIIEIKQIDKALMKSDLKGGVEVSGAHLETKYRVDIK